MPETPAPDAVIAQMLEALQLERAELRARLGPLGDRGRVRVVSGRRLMGEPGAHVYQFACALDLTVPEGTAVRLEVEGDTVSGEVVRHDRDEETLVLLLKQELDDAVVEGFVSFDPTRLLDLIGARLRLIDDGGEETLPPFNTTLALDLLTGNARPERPLVFDGSEGSPAQRAALGFTLGQRVAYVWGPPGTGKTRTLALLVHALRARREQVLIVAHTNVATDTALRRVLDVAPLPPGAALRLGPVGDGLAGCGVGVDEAVERALRDEHAASIAEIGAICAAAAGRFPGRAVALLSAATPLPRRLRAAAALLEQEEDDPLVARTVAELTTQVRTVERAVIARAAVLATTLTRAVISSVSRTLRPAAVIIDEASTAPLATAFAAATLATRRVVAVGDFLQLAPIVTSSAPLVRRWLGTHVFASAGCDRVSSDHPLRVLLDEQWRMHPQIAAVVSRSFYDGRLRDGAGPAARRGGAPAIALVDTARARAISASVAGGSKHNPLHAELVAELALAAAAHREVAVIAPYRAQVRRLRALVRARAPGLLDDGRIEVFSVHRFQGRERGVVFFDTVEAPGTPPRFLDELYNVEAPRLINVALSRAVNRLVIVFHSAHLRALGVNAALPRVLAAARAGGAVELFADDAGERAALAALLAGAP